MQQLEVRLPAIHSVETNFQTWVTTEKAVRFKYRVLVPAHRVLRRGAYRRRAAPAFLTGVFLSRKASFESRKRGRQW